jgi:nucleotide-binding universal stress UspA family protein
MEHSTASPIVVGIDGSKHAIRAAVWAVDEAVDRDAQLLLACVIDPDSSDLDREYAFARNALHKAWAAAEGTAKPVKIESTVIEGDPVVALVELSRSAAMLCVGSRGTHDSAHHDRGSTATALAQAAFAPVAIVRHRHPHKVIPADRWIVAVLNPSPGSHSVMETAFNEALLREASILALTPLPATARPKSKDHETIRAKLDRYRAEARHDKVDVQISVLPISHHISNLVEQSADIDQLIIIGADSPDLVAEVVAPEMRKVLHHTDCSILILRNPAM